LKFQTFFLLGLVLLFSFGGNAQEYFERAYEPEGGIETFSITDIKQDWKGRLWLANYGEGLSMFNGQDFAHYDENNGLSSLKIRCLAFDENENLWVGSVGGGVSIQHNERFIDFSDSIGKIDENVYSLFRDQDKNMWIGTSNGLFLYKKGEMISLNKTISFPNVPIQSIVEDRFGTIWAGSWQSGLYSIKTTGNNNENILFESITEQNGLLSDNISSLAIDTLGNLVIGTFRGMQRGLLDKGSIQLSLNATRGLPNSQVFDIE
jgi:two-component system, sensor histidine kinase ChiS